MVRALEVGGSSLVSAVVLFSLDEKLYSTLSLFTQVYKWALAITILGGGGGVNLAID